MATARDFCQAALRDLNVLAEGETMTASQATDALVKLNDKVDEWKTERLLIFQVTRSTWSIVSGTGAYTVGSGGDVNIARPTIVDHVNFQDTSQSPVSEYQMQPLTDDAYSYIVQKTLTSPYPTNWYYNPTFGSTGLATLTLWPVPTSSTLQGVIYYPDPVAEFASLDTVVYLPPGYRHFFKTALSIALAPQFQAPVSPALLRESEIAKANVKAKNVTLLDLSTPIGALGASPNNRYWWSINTGP